jgi:hypothetical protein
MFMQPCQTRVRVPARADDTRAQQVERRLQRYAPDVRTRVCAAAAQHPRVAELAVVFPGLLFALAVPHPGAEVAHARTAAIAGRPLREAAAAARIPMWLRKLPPETFVRRIPQLPDGSLFARQISNHLPSPTKLAGTWLQTVADAARWGSEALAIWVARELTRAPGCVRKLIRLHRLCLWEWFSTHAHAGEGLVGRPWHPAMRFDTALDAADDWLTRVALRLNLGAKPVVDAWLEPKIVGGYEFSPLFSEQLIAAEAAAMNNCLCRYGYGVAHNSVRLWSVKRDGARVATLSVAQLGDDPLLNLDEMRLADNKPAPVELWLAARQWLNSHELPHVDMQRLKRNTAPLDAAAWRSFWRPYWLAKRCFPSWLPLAPSRRALQAL